LKFAVTSFLLGMIFLHVFIFGMVWREVMAGRPDFSIFYTSALMLRRGQGSELYDNRTQWQTQQEFTTGARIREGPLPYNHPPFEATLFVPLAYFPYLRAYCIWACINFLLLAWFGWFLRPHVPSLVAGFPAGTFLAALAFSPVAFALIHGQDSILLLCLYGLTFAALKSGRDFRAGLLLGVGLFKFHLVLPFVFILCLRRRWRFLEAFFLSGFLAGLVSLLLVGWKELLYYPRYVWEINRHPSARVIAPQNMANLRGLIAGWKWNSSAGPWLDGLVLVVSLALLLWAARRWDAADRSNIFLWTGGFAVCTFATFLVSYHGYNQDMSILLLPLLLVADLLLREARGMHARRRLAFLLAAMFFGPAYLMLTLLFGHQNLFALVLLSFTASLAGWLGAIEHSEQSPLAEQAHP
jgi:hypothetical protein